MTQSSSYHNADVVEYVDTVFRDSQNHPAMFVGNSAQEFETLFWYLERVRFIALGLNEEQWLNCHSFFEQTYGYTSKGFVASYRHEHENDIEPLTEERILKAFFDSWNGYIAWRDEQLIGRKK